ncbi:glycerol-3-phosphate 1-O-acyltransferase PlsY [Rhodophyticola sp. CCM32]|uniref:glycerol-3-phosphate 1-O-acyltransferase PlsY n=1 Tax=Rhodophyticola sp. CCM32 TaxID=2916397 RepID=UPI003FD591D1
MPEFETPFTLLGLVGLVGYLLGSIPFGLVMARLFGLGDIRQIGSGNIGATNVLRTGSKPAAALTLILDAGKGGFAVLLARLLFAEDAAQIAGLAAFLGHCFPVFLGFRGGKGMATFLGTLLVLFWPAGIAACLTWLVTAALSRISSLSALVAALLSPVWIAVLGMPGAGLVTVALAALIFLRHQTNIQRILDGSEPRIGK